MRRILFFYLVFCSYITFVSAQKMTFSTEKGKHGTLHAVFSKVIDNQFELTYSVKWINSELVVLYNKQAQLIIDPTEIKFNTPMVKYIGDKNRVNFNEKHTLKFEISDKFDGGEIAIRVPFYYAPSAGASTMTSVVENVVFMRPRNFAALLNIESKVLTDKTPPKVKIIKPDGADQGMKAIVESEAIRVEFTASDRSGIKTALVNNITAKKINDTLYYADVNLRFGYESAVVISVSDKNNLSSQATFTVESRQPAIQVLAVQNSGFGGENTNLVPEKITPPSDVDIDIPEIGEPNTNRYALIIGNEDYSSYNKGLKSESDVAFALHDATTFKEYAIKILGIPNENIIFKTNATAMEMHRAINQINTISKVKEGEAEIFVMYAGHGFPDEKTQEPYLVPVDVSGSDLEFAIKLTYFYQKLTEHPAKRITVFLDACFSGGGRDQGLLAARAVRVRPKENQLNGNLIIFAAASGDQSALPWEDKSHGMFTYHILKKLKETQGDVSYEELSNYIRTGVGTRSVMVNQKEQNPQTNISPSVGEGWKEWRFR